MLVDRDRECDLSSRSVVKSLSFSLLVCRRYNIKYNGAYSDGEQESDCALSFVVLFCHHKRGF